MVDGIENAEKSMPRTRKSHPLSLKGQDRRPRLLEGLGTRNAVTIGNLYRLSGILAAKSVPRAAERVEIRHRRVW